MQLSAALVLLACVATASAFQMRVYMSCLNDRNLYGMSANEKVWDTFDDQLIEAIEACGVTNSAVFDTTTIEVESDLSFVMDVSKTRPFATFRECANAQEAQQVKRCYPVLVCRTDKATCPEPSTATTTTAVPTTVAA
eukprot:m.95232 g.95232  ORF g.95232 m.95232 type:complete len:138 (+) comp13051_c0_seq1:262-675(+)